MILPGDEDGCGLHFGSRLVGGRPGDTAVGYLPSSYLAAMNVHNIFGGMLAFDKWISNTDSRQAVFVRGTGDTHYRTHFIDQSQCFAGAKWQLTFNSAQGLSQQSQVYRDITGWESFEPFIESLMSASPAIVWAIAQDIPTEWYEGRRGDLEALIESLLRRRSSMYALVDKQRVCTPHLFPLWSKRCTIYMTSGRSLDSGIHAAAIGG